MAGLGVFRKCYPFLLDSPGEGLSADQQVQGEKGGEVGGRVSVSVRQVCFTTPQNCQE